MTIAAVELSRNPSGATITPELAIIPLTWVRALIVDETYRALVRFRPTTHMIRRGRFKPYLSLVLDRRDIQL